jgi:adenine-specific DNA methylase
MGNIGQLSLPSLNTPRFPSTRYQGSKAKLADWIWEHIANIDFHTCLDAFGGTGAVAYRLKAAHKEVTYNDILRFNYHIGYAVIENRNTLLGSEELAWLLTRHSDIAYPDFIQMTFRDIYFTDEENHWLDQIVTNLLHLDDPFKYSIAFFALCQACLIKRPYNLFHRRNLYVRLADVKRSFGNKASWDKPFEEWFRVFVDEANAAVYDNGCDNRALNFDAYDVPGEYDLVYLDPPYLSERGSAVDYAAFYHFLEGLATYSDWHEHIDTRSKHRRMKSVSSPWTDKRQIYCAFLRLFERYRDSVLVVSYRSDGVPSESELVEMMQRYKSHVEVFHYGKYQYVLSTNATSNELLLIGT